MATTLRIDIADQPSHRKGRRREIERGWTDEVLQLDLLTAGELSETERAEMSLRAAGLALSHACRAGVSPRRRCGDPGHVADVERLREWLDGLGLLPAPAPVPAPEPEAGPGSAPVEVVSVPSPPGQEWARRAACRGVKDDRFFGPDDEPADAREAREAAVRASYCDRCPVDVECGAYALSKALETGVWGGLGEALRASLAPSPPVLPAGVKECVRCQEVQPLEAFGPKSDGRGGRVSECRRCRRFVHLRRGRRRAS